MSASVVQERHISTGASVSSVSLAFLSPLTSQSTIHAIGTLNDAVAFAFSDTDSNAYTTLGSAQAYTYPHVVGHAYAPNVAGGTAPTVTASFGATNTFAGLWIREIGGVTASPLDGHAEGASGSVAPTSFTISPANASANAFISALGSQWLTATVTPVADSPLVQDVSGWSKQGAIAPTSTTAHEALSTAATQNVTFSASSAVDFVIVAAIFDEASAPSGVTGSASIVEGADTASASGSLSAAGSATITEQADAASAVATVSLSGSASITESPDSVSASGSVGSTVTASAAITEQADGVAASGTASISAASAIRESSDTASAAGTLSVTATASITELYDILNASGTIKIVGTANVGEGHDIVVGIGYVGPVVIAGGESISIAVGQESISITTGTESISIAVGQETIGVIQ